MQTSQPIENLPLRPQSQAQESIEAETRQNVYVWQLPVRLTHWMTVISLGVLTVTGIYIASPFIITHGDAVNQYLMGSIRFIHFVTAFVFTMSVLFRLYWLFVGNYWSRWKQFLPTRWTRRRGIRQMLGFYVFLRRKAPTVIGHNPLAGLAYSVVFLLMLIQIATGFALYALPYQGGFFPLVFGWITLTFGVQPVRLAHDVIMWLLLAFIVHHVYTAILIDIEERSGLVSSIVSGYKSLTRQQLAEAEEDEQAVRPRRRSRKGGARNV